MTDPSCITQQKTLSLSPKLPFTVDIITLMPALWNSFPHGVIKRALEQELWQQYVWDLRDFSTRKDRRVDDRPYGGGPGMVLQAEPLVRAWDNVKAQRTNKPFLIQMDPAGTPLDATTVKTLIQKQNIAVLCGRYEGIDQRFTDAHVDLCVSVGSFVVSGGDLPAMLLIDACMRLLPGALGNLSSVEYDSYAQNLLDHPSYSRPETHSLGSVPNVLTSGHDAHIALWQREQTLGRTWLHHPQALEQQILSDTDVSLLEHYITAYVRNCK